MRTPAARRGFTLLEVILAMAMMTMLALSMHISLRIAFKARDSATSSLGPMRQASIAMELLRQDFETTLPPTGVMAGPFYGDHIVDGTYSSDTVQMHCMGLETDIDEADFTRIGGVQRIEFAVVALEDGTRGLVRRVTTNLLPTVEPVPDEEVICRGVRNFSILYYDGYTWQEYWDSTAVGDVLPLAVEITLELDPSISSDGRTPRQDAQGNERPSYRVRRVFALPCGREPEVTEGLAL